VDLKALTIKKVHDGIRAKEFSASELTKKYLERIKKYNSTLNAYLTVTEDHALNQAAKIDQKIQNGEEIPLLAGVPAAVKDIFVTKGIRTTASSKMLDDFVPPYESTTTDRLNNQGMIMLGKTNCDAFAFGASTENSGYGPSKNPWDKTKVPGGSSGGSAVAVAAGLSTYAIGTDTGGSIRQPASLCGITGLKLTYGRGSRYGLMAMASSFDTPGPMARTVEDCAIILQSIAGYDENDGTTVSKEVPNYTNSLQKDLKGKKIGVLKESFDDSVEKDVKNAISESLDVFKSLGAELIEISLPELKYGVSAYYILVPSEISSNMSRYDSVRYGHKTSQVSNMASMQSKSRGESFEDEVKRRIMLGNYALSSGYYDAYYLKAAKVRTVIKQTFEKAFENLDGIITPTSPTVAFDIGSKADDPLAMYLADIFTCPVNIAGLPGISVPCGFSGKLPIGLQIIGKAFDEENLLHIGYAFQEATNWHEKAPELE
jgi:aspartyl-tRNA(Asn)/glutamyl-tRNA(Gln) amidotransferase subunit A